MVEARIDEKDSATVDGGFVVIGLGADGRRGSDSACGYAADVPGRVQPASGACRRAGDDSAEDEGDEEE